MLEVDGVIQGCLGTLLAAPGDGAAAKTGNPAWCLKQREKDSLGRAAELWGKYRLKLQISNERKLDLLLIGTLAMIYLPRMLAHIMWLREQANAKAQAIDAVGRHGDGEVNPGAPSPPQQPEGA